MTPAADPVSPNKPDPAALADGDLPGALATDLRDVIALAQADRADEAERRCHRIIAADPEQIEALHLLGMLQYNRGAYVDAVKTLERVSLLRPDFIEARLSMTVAKAKAGAIDEAAAQAIDLAEQAPQSAEVQYVMGLTAERDGKLPEARARYEVAVALSPSFGDAHTSLIRLLLRVGEPRSARAILNTMGDMLSTRHGDADLAIQAVVRDPVASASEVLDAHFAWGVRHGTPEEANLPEPTLTIDPDRPLRLGILLSGDPFAPFAGAGLAIAEALAGPLGGRHITPVLYVSGSIATHKGIEAVAIDAVSDLDLVMRLCADRIDVLIDTIGHERGGRQAALTYSPAPVQLAWGLPVGGRDFAFLLTDRTLIPEDSVESLPQRAWHIDGSVLQSPALPEMLPAVLPKPKRDRNPEPILACFCEGARVTNAAIDQWIEVMRRLPGSCFALTNAELRDGLIRQAVETGFKDRGIDPRRLAMAESLSPERFLDVMSDVDVMLDAHPLSDPATAFRALVMGIPVVTIEGDCPWRRTTASLLRALGLEDLIGEDMDDAAAIASGLVSDTARLKNFRECLRDQVLAWRDGQVERLGTATAGAVREIWRDWCGTIRDD